MANREYRRDKAANTHLLIMVHGFTGHYTDTWAKFPDLILDDTTLGHYDVLMWGYPSKKLGSNPTIDRIGDHLITELDHLPERYEHIVIAAHSMGGLVVRAAIVTALTEGNRSDLINIKQVVLFGTPNEGIDKADYVPKFINEQITDMKTASEFIIDLRNQWLDHVYRADDISDQYHLAIPTTVVAGLQDKFVPYQSVETFFRNADTTDGDHRSMVKPTDPQHLSFKILGKKMRAPAREYDVALDNQKLALVEETIANLIENQYQPLEDQLAIKDQQIADLTKAVVALTQVKKEPNAPAGVDQALEAIREGQTEEAEAIFQSIADADENDAQKRANAYRHIGALAYLHDTQKALDAYRLSTEFDPKNADGLSRFGQLLQRKGDLKGAVKVFEQLITLGDGADESTALAFGNLGNIYNLLGNHKLALEKYSEAQSINEALGRKVGVASSIGNIANIHQSQGDLGQALKMHEKALEISLELGHKLGEANSSLNIGLIYWRRGELVQALKKYQKSLEIYRDLEHKEGQASSYVNIGNVYQNQNLPELALEMYCKALEINQKLGSMLGVAGNHGNIATIYYSEGKLSKALEFYDKALSVNKEINHTPGMAADHANIGLVYEDQGNSGKAEAHWVEALRIFQQLNSPNTVTIEQWLRKLKSTADEDA